MGSNQYKHGRHLPCLMDPFYAFEVSDSEEEDFNIFLCYSMVL